MPSPAYEQTSLWTAQPMTRSIHGNLAYGQLSLSITWQDLPMPNPVHGQPIPAHGQKRPCSDHPMQTLNKASPIHDQASPCRALY